MGVQVEGTAFQSGGSRRQTYAFDGFGNLTTKRVNTMRSELGFQLRQQYKALTGKDGRYYLPFTGGPVYLPFKEVN